MPGPWISVDEHLPKMTRRSYLVHCNERANTYTAYLDEPDEGGVQRWRHFGGDGGVCNGVTHWMELPARPDVPARGGSDNG